MHFKNRVLRHAVRSTAVTPGIALVTSMQAST